MAVSPVGPVATGFGLAALVFASFYLVTVIEDVSIFSTADRSVVGLSADAWAALVISTFFWAFISANEIAGQRNIKDIYTLAPKLAGITGDDLMRALEPSPERRRAGWIAAVLGLVIGAALFIAQRDAGTPERGYFEEFTLVAWWALIATMLLSSLVIRWVVMARGETTEVTDNVLESAQLDLLSRADAHMVGGIALRGALVWLLHAAILFLLFVGQPLNAVLIVAFLFIVTIALMVFFMPLRWVHRLITQTKERELTKVRDDIRRTRVQLSDTGNAGAQAGSRLTGLLAYEARIESVSEWAIDVGTMFRFVGLLSLPVISWTGGAFAERIIDWMIG
ncbi:hypothetical protein BN1012_Phect1868 [Candidatus Phaeomarinobacter ectocarpi]|uniref:Uncharacterized protein n=2 Tax=Candidatus Phaeomarinibacter ectocarpi TaxID=1458461 RepID=X5MNF3_9HYPH|nr:hypothetical protein BN1012_Phect1868 [Candidatus Phaeomarinobacter ectocarpi]